MRRLSLATKSSRASEHEAHINYRNMLLLHRCRHKLNQFEQENVHELWKILYETSFSYLYRQKAGFAGPWWLVTLAHQQ